MEWSDVLADSCLANLPYKIELNKSGNIEMSPASNRHGKLQSRIMSWFMANTADGEAFPECSIQTEQNVKVADVAWASDVHEASHGDQTPYLTSPEIVVEVVSPGNKNFEITTKKELYFKAGAVEVWVCDEKGVMRFFSRDGEVDGSILFPGFPTVVKRKMA